MSGFASLGEGAKEESRSVYKKVRVPKEVFNVLVNTNQCLLRSLQEGTCSNDMY